MNNAFVRMLSRQSVFYLKHLEDDGISPATLTDKKRALKRFVSFVEENHAQDVFTETFLERFQTACGRTNVKKAVRPFSRYLYRQGLIDKAMGHYHRKLPELFTEYLGYMAQIHPANRWPHRIVLTALHGYLTERKMAIGKITIVELDRFMSKTYGHLSIETRNKYRSCLRGFLRHLFIGGHIGTNLTPLLKNKRMFERTLPPRFLLPHEIEQLFGNMTYDTERDLRANAMVYLAFIGTPQAGTIRFLPGGRNDLHPQNQVQKEPENPHAQVND